MPSWMAPSLRASRSVLIHCSVLSSFCVCLS